MYLYWVGLLSGFFTFQFFFALWLDRHDCIPETSNILVYLVTVLLIVNKSN